MLNAYILHKDQFTSDVNEENIWKKIAEKVNKEFPQYIWGPAECRDKVLCMKKLYEEKKGKNSKEVTKITDAIFLYRAKLAFETKENPGKTQI